SPSDPGAPLAQSRISSPRSTASASPESRTKPHISLEIMDTNLPQKVTSLANSPHEPLCSALKLNIGSCCTVLNLDALASLSLVAREFLRRKLHSLGRSYCGPTTMRRFT